MIITPCLGIGDLLVCRMTEISNNFNITHININKKLIEEYSSNYEVKVNFLLKFIPFLFSNVTVEINDIPISLNFIHNNNIKEVYLYNHIDKKQLINIENKYTDYIVFHTKLRYDGMIDNFNNKILPELIIFLQNFKTSKTIIILGEKHIEQNLETIIHKTISLYEQLLLLKNNNNIIDLSHDVLTSGNSDFNSFLNDIEIINKAVCNITFGIGGPFNICMAFSKNVVAFLPFFQNWPNRYNYPYKIIDDFFLINNCVVENINEIDNKINNFCL